jgi:hypothetical protein
MATAIELIYCGGGNPRFYEIARDAGFLYGAQLPDTVYGPLHFADQDWKKPNRDAYMAALAQHRPHMASVLDWEQPEQLSEVLDWAEQATQYVNVIMLIPKVVGGVARLPRMIGGKEVRLGYSVPTNHGGTAVPVWEFHGWPVHLLGGSPQEQMALAGGYHRKRKANQRDLFRSHLHVISVDGNMMQKMATRFCAFWDSSKTSLRGYWPTIQEFDGRAWGDGGAGADAPYEAFRRSCLNIMQAWKEIQGRQA